MVPADGVALSGVLSGVRVVELASWTYVPWDGVALSDWGADVIKVEGVAAGDPGRALVVGGFTRVAAQLAARGTRAGPAHRRRHPCVQPEDRHRARDRVGSPGAGPGSRRVRRRHVFGARWGGVHAHAVRH